MPSLFLRVYEKLVLDRPLLSLAFVALVVALLGSQAPKFKLDASGDSLVLENDKDLKYYRAINKKYGSKDFLIITLTTPGDLLADDSVKVVKDLKADLSKLDRVDSVVSILDVPLVNSPKIKISDLSEGIRTLETKGMDREQARREFLESPVYHKLLMSPNGKTTAILVYYKRDNKYYDLLERRNDLREKRRESELTADESRELETVSREFRGYLAYVVEYQKQDIEAVRVVMDKYRGQVNMFLGGVAMITSDMIDFIRSDIAIFGWGVLFFMIVVLGFFFRDVRWVLLPMGCCLVSVVAMVGYMGWVDWRVTVISSNFISILLIITISLTIHLIVRYGELYAENPKEDQKTLIRETLNHMARPCFYTTITTIVAFCSLVVSGIRPVIDFGWMMTMGVSLSFILSFIFFPALLSLMKPKASVPAVDMTRRLTLFIAAMTLKHRAKLMTLCVVVAVLSMLGVLKLQVENRFIDYFKPSTEIYQGMSVIDRELGGTTPLEIVIDPDKQYFSYLEKLEQEKSLTDAFDDPFHKEEEEEEENYWFHADMLNEVEKIHDYLEGLPEIGKVLSIATTMKVVKLLNDGKMPEDYDLSLYRKLLPQNIKDTFLDPYLSADANQIRIAMRIEETDPRLNRGNLIEKIKAHLTGHMGMAPERINFTGMAVLYNNMLQSLYRSQVLTLGAVFLAILMMFIVLFRNVLLATLAIMPNVLSAGLILGMMGWLGISLDMMTITIAAITIGIAVDDTIHYICRFKEEFVLNRDYLGDVTRCHGSIGRAMYYTSITVTLGFSLLTLSNFIPTIYFGLFTGFAMIVALLNNLVLLPLLIVYFKPLGPEAEHAV